MNNNSVIVSLTSEADRYQTVFCALSAIFENVSKKIYALDEKKDYILIKPNCIDTRKQAAVTHVDGLRAVLDFLMPIWRGRIIIAEGSGLGSTLEAFKNFHYLELKTMFPNLEFLDLNYSESICVTVFGRHLEPLRLKISNTVAEAPFRISIGPPKTHNSVIVTASIKNMAVGAILKEDKPRLHQGPAAINRSIVELNKYTAPHLAVIDGWTSMEGNGPVNGHPIETRFAIASENPLAADILAAELMGFNPIQIGYLNLMGAGELAKSIKVVGCDPENFRFHLKFPPGYLKQIRWEKCG